MQQNIHPNYHELKVTCSCGNKITTKSTLGEESLHIDVCDQCHPFYTGKQNIIDTTGRVEKYNQKYGFDFSTKKSSKKDAEE